VKVFPGRSNRIPVPLHRVTVKVCNAPLAPISISLRCPLIRSNGAPDAVFITGPRSADSTLQFPGAADVRRERRRAHSDHVFHQNRRLALPGNVLFDAIGRAAALRGRRAGAERFINLFQWRAEDGDEGRQSAAGCETD
jgi:hypothetical protein